MIAICDTESKQESVTKSLFQQTQTKGFFCQLAEQRQIAIFRLLNHDLVVKLKNSCKERCSIRCIKGPLIISQASSSELKSASVLIQNLRALLYSHIFLNFDTKANNKKTVPLGLQAWRAFLASLSAYKGNAHTHSTSTQISVAPIFRQHRGPHSQSTRTL